MTHVEYAPKKHSKKRRALGNAQKTKTRPKRPKPQEELGRRCKKKRSNNKVLKQTEKKKKQPASETTWPEAVTTGIFVKQVTFLMVNHCGPFPLRELHSTGEIIVWRDPGGP